VHVPWLVALLLGAAIASTDPATLVPIFRQIKIRDRVAQTVMSESAFNDATGAIMTFAVLGLAAGTSEFSLGAAFADLASRRASASSSAQRSATRRRVLIAHERYSFLMITRRWLPSWR